MQAMRLPKFGQLARQLRSRTAPQRGRRRHSDRSAEIRPVANVLIEALGWVPRQKSSSDGLPSRVSRVEGLWQNLLFLAEALPEELCKILQAGDSILNAQQHPSATYVLVPHVSFYTATANPPRFYVQNIFCRIVVSVRCSWKCAHLDSAHWVTCFCLARSTSWQPSKEASIPVGGCPVCLRFLAGGWTAYVARKT